MSSIKGAKKLQRRIENAIGTISKKSVEAESEVAKKVLKKAQEYAPVVSGELRDSGETEGNIVRFTADYAAVVHELSFSNGHKFLQRAADEVTAEAFEEELSDDDFLNSLFG